MSLAASSSLLDLRGVEQGRDDRRRADADRDPGLDQLGPPLLAGLVASLSSSSSSLMFSRLIYGLGAAWEAGR